MVTETAGSSSSSSHGGNVSSICASNISSIGGTDISTSAGVVIPDLVLIPNAVAANYASVKADNTVSEDHHYNLSGVHSSNSNGVLSMKQEQRETDDDMKSAKPLKRRKLAVGGVNSVLSKR